MKDKQITQKIILKPEEEIPLPDQNEKEEFYSPNVEEQKNNLEIDSEFELKNMININSKNLNDYKVKNCQLVYSEENFSENEKERIISYEKLIDMLNIKFVFIYFVLLFK